jgi:polysaccharide deacetylase family protein (PEP-CTERM system associated)
VKPEIALSFDVEEWFQTAVARTAFPAESWDRLPLTSPQLIRMLLDMLRAHRAKATFFVLGWLIDREPGIVRDILAEGHEFASHGYWHRELTSQTPQGFAEDLEAFAEACRRNSLPLPRGYRAPSFTVVEETAPWVVDELVRQGYAWDSSVYPMFRHRYGMPDAPRRPFRLEGGSLGIFELPIACSGAGTLRMPAGGGAWMRLYPGWLHRRMLRSILSDGLAPVIYSHPWEYGDALPDRHGLGMLQVLRQTALTGKPMIRRMDALLAAFGTIRLGDLAARLEGEPGGGAESRRPGV